MTVKVINLQDFQIEGEHVAPTLPFSMETLKTIACSLIGKSARRKTERLLNCITNIETNDYVVITFDTIGKRRSAIQYVWQVDGENIAYSAELEGGDFEDEIKVTIARLDIMQSIHMEKAAYFNSLSAKLS